MAVFAEGNEAQEALAAGADVVGADDLVDRVKNSKFHTCELHSTYLSYMLVKLK